MQPPLPNLSLLRKLPREELTRNAHSGLYCLDSACNSSVLLQRNALAAPPDEVLALRDFMIDEQRVPTTPNKLGGLQNRAPLSDVELDQLPASEQWRVHLTKDGSPSGLLWRLSVHRKQCTFGASYNFGQRNVSIPEPQNWPLLIHRCLALTKQLCGKLGVDPALYNAAHCNWYHSGVAGVEKHTDSEKDLVEGAPIFSWTFLPPEGMARNFAIYSFDGKLLNEVTLRDGDLLVMQGDMQRNYKHGVPKSQAAALRNSGRLNVTVRAFKEAGYTDNARERPRNDEPASKRPAVADLLGAPARAM
jgi:alkylated DNA repair dioxygenase AlkB